MKLLKISLKPLWWGGPPGPQSAPWPTSCAGPQRPTGASPADQGVRPTWPLVWTLLLCLAFSGAAYPQQLSPAEQASLTKELGEAGTSAVELIRAIENHLAKYPMSPKRAELERVLVRGAIETKDDARLILYGERVLEREQDDPQTLERVARALLTTD